MASTAGESSSSQHMTNAQLLQAKHEAAEAHNATVEEAIDEEDIIHPPPAANHHQGENEGLDSASATAVSNGTMSEKAAGKQTARPAPAKPVVPDTQSEDAFPTLGSSKPRSNVPATAWSAKKINGSSNAAASPHSSGASTPSSRPGVLTPTSPDAYNRQQQQYGRAPMRAAMPGRFSDSFVFRKSELDKTKSMRPYLEILRRRHAVVIDSNEGVDAITITATGRQDQVAAALKELSKEFSSKQKIKLEIPGSLRSQIIGRKGATINELQKSTGAKIQVLDAGKGHDDDENAIVEIEGDSRAVNLARARISEFVGARKAELDVRLRDIPPEFFPFIAGPHNTNLKAMQQDKEVQINMPSFHTWQHQPPPRVSRPEERPVFVAHPNMHIHISGERAAVLQARAQIEQEAALLRERLMLDEQNFPRGQHQFIVGDRGMSPHDFLQKTGCAIIFPPSHHDSEDVVVIGPADRLQAGVSKAVDLAAEMSSANIDIRKHAPTATESYGAALAQYLQKRKIEEELLQQHSAHVTFPTAASPLSTWDIFSRDRKNLMQARNDLTKIVQAYPPPRLSLVTVDPFFHSHLEKYCAHEVQTEHGVHLMVPRTGASDHVVLVYEGPESAERFQLPRQRPSDAELAAFEEALQKAQNAIISIIGDQDVTSSNVDVPHKFHDKLRKLVKEQQQPASPRSFPVQVVYGPPKRTNGQAATTENPVVNGNNDSVLLRGLGGDVTDLEDKIRAFLIEAEADEKERGFTLLFDFNSKHNNRLIGRQGEHVKGLRDRHDVEIDTKDAGKIQIKGPQKKAEACKAEILRLQKQWEDDVLLSLKIEPKFHGDLIGKGGETLKKLEKKTNNEVKIQFPFAKDDRAHADTASDAGSVRHSRVNQAADEITIRGPSAKANQVRDEILSLYQHYKDNAFTATVSVAAKQVRSLVGKNGQEIEKMRSETGAFIDVPTVQNQSDPTARVDVSLRGTKKAVDAAKAELLKRAKAFDDTIEKTIEVDKKFFKDIIGSSGSNIKSIVTGAGGPENSSEAVKFPDRGADTNQIRVIGTATVVDKIIAAIESFVAGKASQVTKGVDVAAEKHRLLIGREGSIRKGLEEKFKVAIIIPKSGRGETIKVTGDSADVAKAIEHIESLTKSHGGATVHVPTSAHNIIAKNGTIFQKLRQKGVKVDHGGKKIPPRPDNTTPNPLSQPNGGAAKPLITDEDDGDDRHEWQLEADEAPAAHSSETIPWILSGKAEEVAEAQAMIEAALADAAKPSATGYLRLADPKLHRFVIGPKGSVINGIRKQTGCDIQVPNSGRGDDSEWITVVGPHAGCEAARDAILDAVASGKAARNANGSRPASSSARD